MKRIGMYCLALVSMAGCDASSNSNENGGSGGSSATPPVNESTLTISAAAPTPILAGTLGVNYWLWAPTWGNSIAGTEERVSALSPGLLRIGGHNNDNNTPDPFDDAELDRAVVYARSIGAEPLLQVPLLADIEGKPASAEAAAAMVAYANVTQKYGIKYFSIGNEPDLYPDQEAGLGAFAPADYCAAVRSFVPAMRAVDPSIMLVGPDLSWKYRPSSQDWLTPILRDCGALFDVVAVHRYPIDPAQTTIERVSGDAARFRTDIGALRALQTAAGYPSLPLAITETNVTYDGDPARPVLSASPGTLAAGLWAADTLGVAIEQGLWSVAFWSVREGWTLGLIDSAGTPRAMYHSLRLVAEHQGSSLLSVTSVKRVNAYATRDAASGVNHVNIVNWTESAERLSVHIDGLGSTPSDVTFLVPALSLAALDIPDAGTASGFVYSDAEWRANSGPAPLSPVVVP